MAEESSCFTFKRGDFHVISVTKHVIIGLSLGACSLAFLFIIFTKAYKHFVHRLALYLIVAAFFSSLFSLLASVPIVTHTPTNHTELVEVKVKDGSEALCRAAGFLSQYTNWVIIMLVCLITLYLLLLVIGKLLEDTKKHIYEVVGVLASLLLPATFNWIPFIDDIYGLAGAWCWIGNNNCTKDFARRVGYQMGVWYAPAVLLVGLNFVAILIIVIVLCKQAWQTRHPYQPMGYHRQYKEALKEALPLLFYTIAYIVLFSLQLASRITYTRTTAGKKESLNFLLWEVQAVAHSMRRLIIPLGFILHPYILRKLTYRELCRTVNTWWIRSTYTTEFIASAEHSSESQVLVIKGGPGELSETGYHSALEGQS